MVALVAWVWRQLIPSKIVNKITVSWADSTRYPRYQSRLAIRSFKIQKTNLIKWRNRRIFLDCWKQQRHRTSALISGKKPTSLSWNLFFYFQFNIFNQNQQKINKQYWKPLCFNNDSYVFCFVQSKRSIENLNVHCLLHVQIVKAVPIKWRSADLTHTEPSKQYNDVE